MNDEWTTLPTRDEVMSEGAVVLHTIPERLYHAGAAVYATRIPRLGITAYADTEEKSQEKLQQMFGCLVRILGREGVLEARLDHSGLPWHKSDSN